MSEPEALQGHWIHSHEEDSGDQQVFRPASYAFPPTRAGRESIELRPDGTYVERAPGPVDAPVESGGGAWSREGSDAWEITSAEADRLTIRRR